MGMASITLIPVYIVYFKQVTREESKPNPATWIIWSVVTLINTFIYEDLTQSLVKSAIAITAFALMTSMMIYCLLKGKFQPLKRLEKLSLVSLFAALAIGIYWRQGGEIKTANVVIQIALLLSFIPTIANQISYWKKEEKLTEKHTPWTLGALAYTFQIIGLLINFDGRWEALLYPFLNGIVGNGSVAIIAIYLKKLSLQRKNKRSLE
jgi:hypothetical protein